MNKKFSIILILFIIFTFIFIEKDTLSLFLINILEYIIMIKKNNMGVFLFFLFLINFVIFLTPIPTTPLIIFNGYILGNYGFILSYLIILVCSILLFKLVRYLKFIFSFRFLSRINKKINKNKNNDLNFLIISSSRYVFPYFIHNIFFGSILKKTNIFFYSILVAEIPIVFFFNQLGKQLNEIE